MITFVISETRSIYHVRQVYAAMECYLHTVVGMLPALFVILTTISSFQLSRLALSFLFAFPLARVISYGPILSMVICSISCYAARTGIEVIKWKRAWPEEAIHVKYLQAGCGQMEPGSVMRVKLATGSCTEQKSNNCPHLSKIKGFNNQWDLLPIKNVWSFWEHSKL